jgi:hypothetical protein
MAPRKLQPAFWGGAFAGVLSALPVLSYANACCCLWVVAGGLLAAWLMQQNHPLPVSVGDGALVGLLAGVVAAVVATALQALVAPLHRQVDLALFERIAAALEDVPPFVSDLIEERRRRPAVSGLELALGFFVMLVVGPLFSVLGGLLGAALFRREAPPAVVPPEAPTGQV